MSDPAYPENMDAECIPLCDALNQLQGVVTTESCCGHKKDNFRIWLKVDAEAVAKMLPFLAQLVATNYCGFPFWLRIEDTGDGDCVGPKGMLVLCFESWNKGKRAYQDADALAEMVLFCGNQDKVLRCPSA